MHASTNEWTVWSRRALAAGGLLICLTCLGFCGTVNAVPRRTSESDLAWYLSVICAGLSILANVTAFCLAFVGVRGQGSFPRFVSAMSILGFIVAGAYAVFWISTMNRD